MTYAQNPHNFFIAHDLDSAGYEWTAMEHTTNDFLVISTLPESSNMTPATGPLRMRVYGEFHNAASIQTNTYQFAGKFRVMNMIDADDQVLVTGGGITIAGLEAGMYFFEVETKQGRGVQKLMISPR